MRKEIVQDLGKSNRETNTNFGEINIGLELMMPSGGGENGSRL